MRVSLVVAVFMLWSAEASAHLPGRAPEAPRGPPHFVACVGRAAPVVSTRGKHTEQLVVDDVVALAGRDAQLRLEVLAGPGGKRIAGVKVHVYVDVCGSAWQDDGEVASDLEGNAAKLAPHLAVGVHEVFAVAPSAGASVRARIWVLPAGSQLAVFDLDGTLTTGDGDIGAPIARPGAAALTVAHAGRGDIVVYLAAGRPDWMAATTRGWLIAEGFADGPLLLAPRDLRPTPRSVGGWKARRLAGLSEDGHGFVAAYGSTPTDVLAYHAMQIAPTVTYIVGKHGGEGGTVAVPAATAWAARATEVEQGPVTPQPFSR